jgi:hypothetical protein
MSWILFLLAELVLISAALFLSSLHWKWSIPADEYEGMDRMESPKAYGQ